MRKLIFVWLLFTKCEGLQCNTHTHTYTHILSCKLVTS